MAMNLLRREALQILVGGVAATAVCARSTARPIEGAARVTKQLPPFDLQGTPASLASLGGDIASYSVVRAGPSTFAVWLKSKDGSLRYVGIDEREPVPMFEVFTLAIATMDELEARWRDWKPPKLSDDTPEPFRTLATTRPAAPTPPAELEPWPFDRWRTQVLCRAEFIVDDVHIGPTFGNNPKLQSAARPSSVPPEASASCAVAAGILFTGASGHRLLMGVDWMPENMLVTDAAAKIDEYLQACEAIDLMAYMDRLSKHP